MDLEVDCQLAQGLYINTAIGSKFMFVKKSTHQSKKMKNLEQNVSARKHNKLLSSTTNFGAIIEHNSDYTLVRKYCSTVQGMQYIQGVLRVISFCGFCSRNISIKITFKPVLRITLDILCIYDENFMPLKYKTI